MTRAPQDPHEELGARIRAAAQDVRAPAGLQARIATTHAAADRPRRPARRTWAFVAAGASVTAAALIAVLVLVLAPGAHPLPTVDAAAAFALRSPTAAAPAIAADDPHYVDASVGSIRFPSNAYTTSATPSGLGEGRIAGRRAVAVTYGTGDARVGYAVVDGPALPVPAGATRTQANGIAAATYRRGGAQIVTWRRDGHTCVVASRTVPLPELLGYVSREA